MGRDLIIGNPPITVDLRRSARARRLSLRVSRLDGKVTLTMPPRAPEREALASLKEREGWLRGHLSDVTPAVTVTAAQEVLFRGRMLRLAPGPGRRIVVQDDCLLLPAGAGPASVKAFLKTCARDALVAASDGYAAQIGRSYSRLTLRDTRSRWGSCSSSGALMYSWRLIMAPPEVLDYVAAHEVAHLAQMNHSPAFWAEVTRIYGDYATPRKWLRQNGSDFHRYRFDGA